MQKIGFSLRQVVTPAVAAQALQVLDFLWSEKKEVFFTDHALLSLGCQINQEHHKRINSSISLDLFVFMGGDGTLLKSFHEYAPLLFKTPIFGIHAGRVGFFSSVKPENAQAALQNIFANTNIHTDARMVLQGELLDAHGEKKTFYALNECTLHHAGIARLRNISTWVDDEFLTTYRADGVIVASPSGSTAYNLAAGGPIVAVDTEGIVITPLAPSGFSQRSIVVSAQKKITLQADAHMLISVDGQDYFPFPTGSTLSIYKYHAPLVFLRQQTESYFSTLREKLGWG